MKTPFALAFVAAAALVSATPVLAAESPAALPVPGYPAAQDVPGAHELPDPTIDYRIVFSIGSGAEDMTAAVNPSLKQLATYVNTLAKYGVPADKRHIIVMFHQRNPDFEITLSNAAFKTRHGTDNPNVALIHDLKAAGVEFRACGQAVVNRKIDPSEINPDIQIDLWAMTSMLNLQMKGYVRTGN